MTVNPGVLRLNIGNHNVLEIPNNNSYMREWFSANDPPKSWYKTYSTMRYEIIERFDRDANMPVFYLTPVPKAIVYTFDDWGQIIDSTREFTVRLLFPGRKKVPLDVAMYRPMVGAPRPHELYALPPFWRQTA